MGIRHTESERLPTGSPETVRKLAEPGGKGENHIACSHCTGEVKTWYVISQSRGEFLYFITVNWPLATAGCVGVRGDWNLGKQLVARW